MPLSKEGRRDKSISTPIQIVEFLSFRAVQDLILNQPPHPTHLCKAPEHLKQKCQITTLLRCFAPSQSLTSLESYIIAYFRKM